MPQTIVLYLSLLFIQIALYCLSLGSIVQKASETTGLRGTATLIGIQAMAVLLALGLSILSKKSKSLSRHLSIALLGLWFSSSIFLYFSETFSGPWLCGLLIRLTASFWMSSFLLASIPAIITGDALKANKVAQYSLMFGNLLGCAIGPILVSQYGLKFISALDIIFTVLIFIGIGLSKTLRRENIDKTNTNFNLDSPKNIFSENKFMLPVYYISTAMCILTGIFSVVEVPILKERFSANAETISLVYVGTILLNLFGMKLSPALTSFRHLSVAHTLSATMLIIATNAYLFSYTWLAVIFSLILFGLSNGVFNLAQSNIVQLLKSQSQRLSTFLLFSFISQFTLFFSVALSFLVHETAIPTAVLFFSVIFTIPFFGIIHRSLKTDLPFS